MKKRRAIPKTHVTLSIDHQVWCAFQLESATRKLTASEQVEKFMIKQLTQWKKGQPK